MTQEGEDVRVREHFGSPVGPVPVPRLFGMVRGADQPQSRDADDGQLIGLLDRECLGVRGEPPATRQELAELIIRYREEQAHQRSPKGAFRQAAL